MRINCVQHKQTKQRRQIMRFPPNNSNFNTRKITCMQYIDHVTQAVTYRKSVDINNPRVNTEHPLRMFPDTWNEASSQMVCSDDRKSPPSDDRSNLHQWRVHDWTLKTNADSLQQRKLGKVSRIKDKSDVRLTDTLTQTPSQSCRTPSSCTETFSTCKTNHTNTTRSTLKQALTSEPPRSSSINTTIIDNR